MASESEPRNPPHTSTVCQRQGSGRSSAARA